MKVIRLAAITRLSVLLLMGGCISSRPGALLNGIKTDDIEYRSDDGDLGSDLAKSLMGRRGRRF